MNRFQPSGYATDYLPSFTPSAYGQDAVEEDVVDEDVEEAPAGSPVDQIMEYIPVVRGLLAGQDPEQQAATLRAKIKNHERMLRNAVPLLKPIYRNELNKLREKLIAVELQAADQRTSTQIHQAGRAATVGVVVLGGVLLAGVSYWVYQKGALASAQRKALG